MVLCMTPTEERQPYQELEVNFATMNLNSWQVQRVLQAPPHPPHLQLCCSVHVIVVPASSANTLTLCLALVNSVPQRKEKLHLMNICYEL